MILRSKVNPLSVGLQARPAAENHPQSDGPADALGDNVSQSRAADTQAGKNSPAENKKGTKQNMENPGADG